MKTCCWSVSALIDTFSLKFTLWLVLGKQKNATSPFAWVKFRWNVNFHCGFSSTKQFIQLFQRKLIAHSILVHTLFEPVSNQYLAQTANPLFPVANEYPKQTTTISSPVKVRVSCGWANSRPEGRSSGLGLWVAQAERRKKKLSWKVLSKISPSLAGAG